MGRSRLRRGYSLEVIFEEDPDFCSHLDSLDSVAIRFGVKEADDTISIDSLVEEYQIRFQGGADKEHVFRSLDGIWDARDMDTCFIDWEDFSSDTNSISKMPPGAAGNAESHKAKLDGDVEIPTNGRRSRVSRRQIVEASWVFDSSDDNDNDSGSNDNGSNDNDSTWTEVEMKDFEPETEIKPILVQQNTTIPHTISVTAEVHRSESKSNGPQFGVPIDIRLTSNSNKNGKDTNSNSDPNSASELSPPRALFGNMGMGNMCRIGDGAEKDTLDSYISTRTDDTDTNAYTFADSDHFNDTCSIASTAYESSASSSSTGSVCTVNGMNDSPSPKSNNSISNSPNDRIGPKFRTNLNLELQSRFLNASKDVAALDVEIVTPELKEKSELPPNLENVKRVRAMFENSSSNNSTTCSSPSRKSSLGEVSNASSSSSGSSQRLYSKNPVSPTNSHGAEGGIPKKLKQLAAPTNQHQAVKRVLRSAYSHISLNHVNGGQMVDFADLLVNDKIVIEDSPDLFQTMRNSRHREKLGKGSTSDPSMSGFSNLRRSRSMGTGIALIEASLSPKDKLNGAKTSKTIILAEEMPAPDTVKNVRTVFEQILKMRNTPSTDISLNNGDRNSFSIIKKSLSSVKSNPTSKIYRSESMRDDFPVSSGSTSLFQGRKFGKPILVNESGSGTSSSPVSPVPSASGEISSSKNTQLTQLNGNNSATATLRKHAVVERQHSEPIKFSPKINSPIRPRDHFTDLVVPPTLTEEELSSILSSLNDIDDNPPKFVSPEVLQRIRSCGTTTTYFGGQVIAQSVKNRKPPASRRHTLMDFQEFNQDNYSRSNTSCSNNSNGTTPTPTLSRSSASSQHEREEFFTPPPIPDYSAQYYKSGYENGNSEGPLVKQKYLPRLSPIDLEDVFNLGTNAIDTKPRIISVVPKSPSGSPTKSTSPVGSIIEGRATPEGCEGQEDLKCQWINEIPVDIEESRGKIQDGNNNEIENGKVSKGIDISGNNEVLIDRTFSEVTEGAWF